MVRTVHPTLGCVFCGDDERIGHCCMNVTVYQAALPVPTALEMLRFIFITKKDRRAPILPDDVYVSCSVCSLTVWRVFLFCGNSRLLLFSHASLCR